MAEIKIQPGETRIGWIGTGVMGASMCGHLIDKGFTATVYNRSKEKAAGLLEKGAAWADKAYAIDLAHSLIECSNAGLCNRDTGKCECFDGYSGLACQRCTTQ